MFASTKLNFAKLIDPILTDTFIQEYWEEKPLIVSRQESNYYQELFSVKDLDCLLYSNKINYPTIRVVKNQEELLPAKYTKENGSLNLNQLYKAYYEDHTLVINGLNQFWHPLAQFCSDLQNFLNHNVVANMYLSPKQSKGLHPHFDTHDVFVLQIEGSKEWWIHSPIQATPLLNSFQPVIPEKNLGKPLHSVRLEAGDLLYIPRGFIHHAATKDSFSLHLTIGIYPIQWMDLIVNSLLALSMENRQFRQALPIGFLNSSKGNQELEARLQKLTQILAEKANSAKALELIKDNFIRNNSPIPDGHFVQVNQVDAIDINTIVIKRPNMPCRVIDKLLSVSIQFPGNTINGSKSYQAAMEFIAEINQDFSVNSLPNSLEKEKKINLVRRLVRGGLLKVIKL